MYGLPGSLLIVMYADHVPNGCILLNIRTDVNLEVRRVHWHYSIASLEHVKSSSMHRWNNCTLIDISSYGLGALLRHAEPTQ